MELSRYRRSRTCSATRSRGFTLIELIVAIVIVAIAAALALPSMRELLVRNTVTTTTNDLVVDLNTARAEAVKRGFPVAVIAKSGGWINGWDIRVDGDGDGSFTTTAPDELVREHAALTDNFKLFGAPKSSGAPATTVAFNGSGASLGGDYDFVVCRPDANNEQNRAVLVQRGGMISSRRKPTGLATSCP
jgi:type IV fimbrial biogenesis protein FimT